MMKMKFLLLPLEFPFSPIYVHGFGLPVYIIVSHALRINVRTRLYLNDRFVNRGCDL